MQLSDIVQGMLESEDNMSTVPSDVGSRAVMQGLDPVSAREFGRQEYLSNQQGLQDNTLDFIPGAIGGRMATRNLSRAKALDNWREGADPLIKGKPFYHGFERPFDPIVKDGNIVGYGGFKRDQWHRTPDQLPRHDYQRTNSVFGSPSPEFAAPYSGRNVMGSPPNASKADQEFLDKVSSLDTGEGNMMQLEYKNKNVFNPFNDEHYGRFKKSGLDGDIRNKSDGWMVSEKMDVQDWMNKEGFDGQMVLENDVMNIMTNRPDMARNVFDKVDTTNKDKTLMGLGGIVGLLVGGI